MINTKINDPLHQLNKELLLGKTKGGCKLIWLPKVIREIGLTTDTDLGNAIQELLKSLSKQFNKLCSREGYDIMKLKTHLKKLSPKKYSRISKNQLIQYIQDNIEVDNVITQNEMKSIIENLPEEVEMYKSILEKFSSFKKYKDKYILITDKYFDQSFDSTRNMFIAYEYLGMKELKTKRKPVYDICAFLFTDDDVPLEYPFHKKDFILANLSLVCSKKEKKSGNIIRLIEHALKKVGVSKIILESANKNSTEVYLYFGYQYVKDNKGRQIEVDNNGELLALLEKRI